ncbi:DUF4145 domain-containing protein [Nocardia sp. NPDC051900]|uniref:DUF4145 domain-containing protein n=1 Tax=Nocardia sp. NPDC051900 TaxID=3364326 RepID=UPI0037968AAF
MPGFGTYGDEFFDDSSYEEQIRWYPTTALGKDFPDVPAQIESAACEATQCLGMQYNRAAVILARAVVEAVAKDKNITTGSIQAKIDEMHKQGLIRAHTKDAAHEIRFLANEMAHGDFTKQQIPQAEAEDVLNFMSELLAEVYQGPARVDRQRAARLARKAQAGQNQTGP